MSTLTAADLRQTTFTATFTPEAWASDQAIEVDPEGPTEWDATAFAHRHADYLLGLEARSTHESLDGIFGVLDNDDVFQADPAAPEWVRDWRGPFTIRVRADEPLGDD